MKKKVRQISMSRVNGTYEDMIELYELIGKIRLTNDYFDIQVKIVEYKEIKDVEE